jgi:predicted nucleic acid-binding protein
MVVFDATVLIDLFNPKATSDRRLRLDLLVLTLEKQKQKVVVPAPAYTEFLIGAASARDAYQARIEKSSTFRVEPYSKKVAMECAILLSSVFSRSEKRAITKTKLKFDWMIVATAKALDATCLYTGDDDVIRCSSHAGVASLRLDDLPLPTVSPQLGLPFDAGSGKGSAD